MEKKIVAVAASALAATATGAMAEEATSGNNEGLKVSIEGGFVMSDFTKDTNRLAEGTPIDKLGDLNAIEKDIGGYGAISIGRNFEGSDFDWRISGSMTEFLANDQHANSTAIAEEFYDYVGYDYGYGGDFSADDRSDFDFQTLDFDLGRTFENNAVSGRIFAGVRAMHATSARSSEIGYGYADGYESGNVDYRLAYSDEFFGVGPRLGMDLRVGGTVGIAGGVAAAAIYGRKEAVASVGYSADYEYYADYGSVDLNGSANFADWDWLTNVQASLGLSIKPSDSTELVVGYRGEMIKNFSESHDLFGGDDDMIAHGPFLKLNVKF